MDPCPFVRVLIGNLSLKIPTASRPSPAAAGVHPSTTPCYCKIRLNNLPYQTSSIPLELTPGDQASTTQTLTLAALFHLSSSDLAKLASASSIFSSRSRVMIAIYTGTRGTTCGRNSGKLLGKLTVPLDLKGAETRVAVHQNGWIPVGRKETKGTGSLASLHVTVRSEPDPRFVFEFGGEPECSPQVFQVQGGRRQPVFTCKFTCRNSGSSDRHGRSRLQPMCVIFQENLYFKPSSYSKGYLHRIITVAGIPIKLPSSKVVRWIKWHPPDDGLKLNCDGSSIMGDITGGGIVRDTSGNFIIAYSAFFGKGTHIQAEAQAMIAGIEVCRQHSRILAVAETDSLTLHNIINGSTKPPGLSSTP